MIPGQGFTSLHLDGNMAMGHNLWLHFGVDEQLCAAYFEVHQGYQGFDPLPYVEMETGPPCRVEEGNVSPMLTSAAQAGGSNSIALRWLMYLIRSGLTKHIEN